jgi:hypothetical protein
MLDYSEGVLRIKDLIYDVYQHLLANKPSAARIALADIRVIANQLDEQIVKQFPKETGHD